jgi:hypothetical protein
VVDEDNPTGTLAAPPDIALDASISFAGTRTADDEVDDPSPVEAASPTSRENELSLRRLNRPVLENVDIVPDMGGAV